ncbi:MAG: sigma-70 family RNA polymerase sigma factor [Bacteroidota bacterium]
MNSVKDTDVDLIESIRDSSDSALEKLLKRHYTSLYHFSFQFLKSKDLADEAVFETFIAIWEHRKSLPRLSNVKAYLFKTTKYKALNILKKEQGAIFLSKDDENQPCAASDIERKVIAQETFSAIDRVIAKMPKQRQLIFRLNRIEGLKYKEIADLLDISINTVQNQMVNAVKFLHDNCPDHRQHR